ncbi:Kelch repeat-containing protein 3 [Stygiomarasmius scandens]|uniref:Kelch repeat-containing protein 3 n=1 Tax=Marasmiellus scandens TaxID=2682957 RepID=A0ABR1IWS5_9AGAR
MGKKKSSSSGKLSAKALKKAKIAQKVEKKEKKKSSKSKDVEDNDEDLESILEKMRKEWEETHAVTEELVEGPPSRRANATLTPCPNGNHLWCIGGEFFSEDGKAYFVCRYNLSANSDRSRAFVNRDDRRSKNISTWLDLLSSLLDVSGDWSEFSFLLNMTT